MIEASFLPSLLPYRPQDVQILKSNHHLLKFWGIGFLLSTYIQWLLRIFTRSFVTLFFNLQIRYLNSQFLRTSKKLRKCQKMNFNSIQFSTFLLWIQKKRCECFASCVLVCLVEANMAAGGRWSLSSCACASKVTPLRLFTLSPQRIDKW